MELFINPWYMIAGGLLVSAPIIIHLINRMRFKRIRWAAMEFLLKSQKRNRRRLIIEQLLLLLLRILMVLLIAFLVARFVGNALGATSTGTIHAVVIDDTLSMSDRWVKDGQTLTAFDVAKDQVRELAKTAGVASSAQFIKVMLLSDPEKVLLSEAISDRTPGNLDKALGASKATALHVGPQRGLLQAQDEALGAPQGQKIVHFISDFRESDWSSGPDTAEIGKAIQKLLENKIALSLIDTAHPFRKDTGGLARNHDNLCILSLKSDSRIIPEGIDVNFEVVLRNNSSNSATNTALTIRVNGREENRGTTSIASIAAGQDYTHRFDLRFNKASKAPVEYVHIRAEIKPSDTGLEADHVRDLVLELRSKIPVLVVDGRGNDGLKQGGDLFYVQPAIDATESYVAVPTTLEQLELLPLETYAAVYLLNVKSLSETVTAKLKEFVNKGGNLAYFLGPEIQASFYNEVLHVKEDGLFPVMIELRPTEPLTPKERQHRLQEDPQRKILYRDKSHPIVREGLAQNPLLDLVIIDRYHPTKGRFQWVPNAQKEVVEVLTLPSQRTVDSFKQQVEPLRLETVKAVKDLAEIDKTVQPYVGIIEAYSPRIRTSLEKEFTYDLTVVLDNMLNDPGELAEKGDTEAPAKVVRPSMPELWARPQLKQLATMWTQIRESALYGDPLMVARPYGKGKVVAFLSSAGPQANEKDKQWNRLADGDPGSGPTFMMMMIELQRYLTSQMDTQNRVVSADPAGITLTFPEDRYQDTIEVRSVPHPNFKAMAEAGANQDAVEKPEWSGKMTKGDSKEPDAPWVYKFDDARKPGVYVIEVTRKTAEAGAEKERILFAFNVDPEAESNLKRSPRERLDKSTTLLAKAKEAKVYWTDAYEPPEIGKVKSPDASESPWLYLLFLIILIAEQALAVHLSYHLKGNESSGTPTRSTPEPVAA